MRVEQRGAAACVLPVPKAGEVTFFDVTTGNNDLADVGCCHATVGYDLASGLGVPNWAVLPATLPPPG